MTTRDATQAVRWQLHAWETGGILYRHWFDPELAVAWATRFLSATTLYDQLFCWARWIEAANLGAYALRRVGADPTSAPLGSFAVMVAGKHGLPFPPASLCETAPRREQRNGMVNEYVSTKQVRRRWWQFGAVETEQQSRAFDSLACAVVGNKDQYDNVLFERKLVALLTDFGADATDVVGRIKRVGGDWLVLALPTIPGLSIALKWNPVALDGYYDVAYVDDDEARLRSSACFADLSRAIAPNAYLDGDSPAVVRTDAPASFLPDLALRQDEARAFTLNPARWIEIYTDSVIRRNQTWLARVSPELAANASSASRSRAAAFTASSAALNTLNTLNKNELTRQITDVAGVLDVVPVLGQIAGAILRGFASFLSGVGAFDIPPEQKAEMLRQTVAPLAISGAISADDAKSEAPTHATALPAGWKRGADVPMPSAVFRSVVTDPSSVPLDPAQARVQIATGRTSVASINLGNLAGARVLPREVRYAQLYPADYAERAARALQELGPAPTVEPAQRGSFGAVVAVGVGIAALGAGAVLLSKKRRG